MDTLLAWLLEIPDAVAVATVSGVITFGVRWWDRRKSSAEAATMEIAAMQAIIGSQWEYIQRLEARERRPGSPQTGADRTVAE